MGSEQQGVEKTGHADRGVLGYGSNPEARFIRDHATLKAYVEALKTLGMKIVLTSGTFDLIHVGHARYMERAKSFGDVLIVGVDSDAKVKKRKGPTRPIVPEDERVQMLAFLRSVDLITLKQHDDPKWNLIKIVEPDCLIATAETYDASELKKLEKYCKKVVVLAPQATTSTSAQIRRMQISWSANIVEPLSEVLSLGGLPEKSRIIINKILKGASGRKK
ncbi:adenylyltransferase/cytidyltransferase family protein [Candidatus Saccharibacteria bacterium]|nr:MAG: adenylyltransferase/cytidyltransferase family protein [Candidatus Saccharibacteria bacterium]